MARVSVVMPVYNTKEEYLREAIESILKQTFTDFEFIIINDGSTNNVEEVVLSYEDDRIKYVKQEHYGIPYTRNKTLDLASGEYIALMDSDDVSLPERLEKQVKYLDENKDVSLVGAAFEFFPDYKLCVQPICPKVLDFLRGCSVGHPTVMLRKHDFDKYNLRYNEDFKTAEDYELWSRAIRVLKFVNLQEVLLKYRWHGNNNSWPSAALAKYDTIIRNNILDFLTSDENLQNRIRDLVFPPQASKPTLIQRIFSIRNEFSKSGKYKVIRIIGLKISIRKNK